MKHSASRTAAHTPGPWSVVVEGHEAFILNNGDNAPQGITSIVLKGAGMNYSESLANARLIAAAPELLAALKAAVSILSQPVQSTPMKDDVRALQAAVDILRADARAAVSFCEAAIASATRNP